MKKQSGESLNHYRVIFARAGDADFVVYQRHLGNGAWQTLSSWMIPGTDSA